MVESNESSKRSQVMNQTIHYQHLERRPGSNHKQLFVKGRRIRAANTIAILNHWR